MMRNKLDNLFLMQLLCGLLLCGTPYRGFCALPGNSQIVLLTATVQSSPPTITLNFVPGTTDGTTTYYDIYRRVRGTTSWQFIQDHVPGPNWTDTDVSLTLGTWYEYKVVRHLTGNAVSTAEGYLVSGIELPPFENRGKVILLVDKSLLAAPNMEGAIQTLTSDLVADGWRVLRHDVERGPNPITF